MKKHIIVVLICITSFCSGQQKNLKRADKLFTNKAYIEAANLYKDMTPDAEILKKLGDCYYYNSQMKDAVQYYSTLIDNYSVGLDSIVKFNYAHALMGINDYENADKFMTDYLNQPISTKIFKEKLNKTIPYNYEVTDVNTGFNEGDFGLSYFGNDVVFASLRNTENPTYQWNNKPYLDLFTASISDEKSLENITALSKKINSETHESNAVISKDGNTLYFSRTNHKRTKIGDEKYAVVKIYKAELIDDEWENIVETSFSSDLYSTQHPALNALNSKLYFSSNMPGSNGSFDIYYVDILEDGFGEPVNLGSIINTNKREQFPFIDESNSLYFASDGHQGLGGLDIFQSQFIDDTFNEPLNLGQSINTGMDDFGFVLNDSIQEGFLSSNRTGTDKIYAFTRTENNRTYAVTGTVSDKHTKALLPDTKVTLFDIEGNIVGEMIVGEDATYLFETKPNTQYKIEGYRSFYIPTLEQFDTNEDGTIEYNIELVIESYDDAEEIVVTKTDGYIYIELENIYFDLDKWDIKPQAAEILDVLVNLLKKYPRMEIQLGAHTDSRSSDAYNLQLSLNRANSTLNYLVSNGINASRLTSKGYGESEPLIDCKDNCTEDEHAINRRCEFKILK